MRILRYSVWFVMIPWGLAGADAPAAFGQLQLRVEPVAMLIRSHAPVTVNVTLDWPSPELLEGELHLSFRVRKRQIAEYRSGPLAMSTGGLRFRMMLQPIDVQDDTATVTALATFVTDTGERIDLGEHDVRIPPNWRRLFVIAVSHPWGKIAPPAVTLLSTSLHPEQFHSDPNLRGQIATFATPLAPDDFPTSGLGYFSFDMLVLTDVGLTELRGRQLKAIADWVEAGGSVCIGLTEQPLSTQHVTFLNRLAGATESGPRFLLDDAGKLAHLGETQGSQVLPFRLGLGRAVIAIAPPTTGEGFDTPEWRKAVAFLWKFRYSQTQAVVSSGQWQFDPQYHAPGGQNRYNYNTLRPFAPASNRLTSELQNLLLPSEIEGLPVSVVVAILASFLLAIGPGDYYLLGYFRRRKYTWALFLVVSLVFTVLTMNLAGQYMGSRDYLNTLTLTDIDDRGQVVRSVRYEMLFTATQRRVDRTFRNTICAAMNPRGPIDNEQVYGDLVTYRTRFEDYQESSAEEVQDLPVFSGRMPTLTVVQQQMRQWSPRLTRLSTLDAADVPFDWSRIDPDQFETDAGRRSIVNQLRAQAPVAAVLLFHGDKVDRLDVEGATARSELSLNEPPLPTQEPDDSDLQRLLKFLQIACRQPEKGWFAICSQMSPAGGRNYEDLAIVDSSDPDQRLLAVVTQDGDNFTVYRKLYWRRP